MQISDNGLLLIKQSEGFRNSVYEDVAGIPTIGYGHRLLPGEDFPDGITEEQASAILAKDVEIAETAVNRFVRVPLTQGKFDALVDLVFNLGSSRLRNSTLLVLLNEANYDAAAFQLLKWDHSGSVEVPGLKKRREAEFNLWRS